ncbi:hypothetical protein [Deinococcus sedimenti]|uniref:Uncharacterized protein n=1 Tax=Deinococcus sedimenti TaxID=1867090 RepID=A0ABQ2S490_9DEIO|nr:hypothetical protein [Deinococcus sedimenti]GGR93103.1 hypothetical protein GCM10008960_20080 [Deinococcus sedimenti]
MSAGLPAFLTIVAIPLTFDVANGVSFGMITTCAVKVLAGRARQVSPVVYAVAALLLAR